MLVGDTVSAILNGGSEAIFRLGTRMNCPTSVSSHSTKKRVSLPVAIPKTNISFTYYKPSLYTNDSEPSRTSNFALLKLVLKLVIPILSERQL
jgi:hypothetical protein